VDIFLIGPSFMMFMYTYGLAEALQQMAALPCSRFVEELFSRLVDYRGSDSFDDDACIICLEIECSREADSVVI
jgi:hypothetical protein